MNEASIRDHKGLVTKQAQGVYAHHHGRAHMPLSFLKSGERAQIAKVRDKSDLHHHLETLGFVEGASIVVVCENDGNLIVEIKGTQVALNKQVAAKIITR